MKPYPIAFRQKIIRVYENENTSIRKLAQRFQVAKSFIQKLLKQYRETGLIEPLPQGGSPPSLIQEEQLITLIEIIENNNDATLEELCDLFQDKTSIKVSRATKVKAILRKAKARTYKDLIDNITDAMLKVTKDDSRNWFAHCCYCT
jgi:transposase